MRLLPCSLLAVSMSLCQAQEVKMVPLLATVRNQFGAIVKDLNSGDFRIEEDGRPQRVAFFSRASDLPLTIALLVNAGPAMRPMLEPQRVASTQFLDQMLRKGADNAGVLRIDGGVAVLQGFTNAKQVLAGSLAALQLLPPGRGGPRMYDAVEAVSESLRPRSGSKHLIVLSDSDDAGSKESIANALESTQRGNATIYTILFDNSGQKSAPGMERLARETGGGFFRVSSENPIGKIYAQIEEELRNQYAIGYAQAPGGSSANYRKLKVTTIRKEWDVRTRDGYYAPEAPSFSLGRFLPGAPNLSLDRLMPSGPVGFVAIAFVCVLYLVPTLIALGQGRKNPGATIWPVFLLNLLLGWTIIGWFIALARAFNPSGSPRPVNQPMAPAPASYPVPWQSDPPQNPPQPASNPPAEPVKCPSCNGTGTQMCSSCGGRGSHYEQPQTAEGVGQLVYCSMCTNSGRLTCTTCVGTGRASW